MTGAAPVSEDQLAWDLVERHRDCLADDHCDTIFVDLGTGEYERVIRRMLTALARHGRVLPSAMVTQVQTWMIGYGRGDFGRLLDEVSPTGCERT